MALSFFGGMQCGGIYMFTVIYQYWLTALSLSVQASQSQEKAISPRRQWAQTIHSLPVHLFPQQGEIKACNYV